MMQRAISQQDPASGGAVRGFRARVEALGGAVDLLLFRAGSELFGVELTAVAEVLDAPAVHRIPEMPPALLGVFTLRGTLVSLYAPTPWLGVSLRDGATAIVFHGDHGQLALAVDDVDDVLTLHLPELLDVPGADAGDGVLAGVARRGRDLIGVVDLEYLLPLLRAGHVMEAQ